MKRGALFFWAALLALACGLQAEEAVDLQMVSRIRHEGFENSQVMDILEHLTDVSGPRLTGSPGLARADQWSRGQLEEWGLVNAAIEPWGEFGIGWSLEDFSISMTEPYFSPLIGYAHAWSPSVGPLSGAPIPLEIESEDDLEKYQGKLKDAIVMLPMTREAETHFEADASRRSEQELKELAMAPEPRAQSDRSRRRREFRRLRQLRNKVYEFLRKEGVRVVLDASRGEHGTLFVSGGRPAKPEDPAPLPRIAVSAEHYARILRLLKREIPVNLKIQLKSRFHDDDLQAYNVVAEIPGTDPVLKDQLVMLGGHIDSWHSATGATDNAVGVAVAMEAVRILKALDVQPRRTIRIALWSGEEQGLMGSRAYVKKHFADRETMELKPAHSNFSAYYNLDNGTGKIRGVYLQGNAAVRPIFQAYLEPFKDLGADTVTIRNTGGTDHLAFDAVGLPGFQFVQDPIDYGARTHHTNMDFYDHALPGDLMQASVIMASFVYHTAMREEMLPRKELPEPQPDPRRQQQAPAGDPATTTGSR